MTQVDLLSNVVSGGLGFKRARVRVELIFKLINCTIIRVILRVKSTVL